MNRKFLFLMGFHNSEEWYLRQIENLCKILQATGNQTEIVYYKKSWKNLSNTNRKLFFLFLPSMNLDKVSFKKFISISDLIFWDYSDLKYQLLILGILTPQIALKQYNKVSKIVEKWNPSLIIGCGNPLSYPLAQKYRIPLVQICTFNQFPDNHSLKWWDNHNYNKDSSVIPDIFQFIYDGIQQTTPTRFNQLFSGDGYLIPGISEIEPVQSPKPYLHFGYEMESKWDERLLQLDQKKRERKLYIELEPSLFPIDYHRYLDYLISFCEKFKGQIILKVPTRDLFRMVKDKNLVNVSIFNWLRGPEVLPYLDVMIYNGGNQNKYTALARGIPSCILPLTTEQESNGRILEKAGAGKMLKASDETYTTFEFEQESYDFSFDVGTDWTLPEEALQEAVDQMMDDAAMADRLIEKRKKLRDAFEPEKIFRFIQSFL